mmetsp:Transcript_7971/g.26224  ORF Transcript_7971/g.26224 Transcript_7971/m.26224 type:complete len:202 (-) Transcript_7971:95-700(-)
MRVVLQCEGCEVTLGLLARVEQHHNGSRSQLLGVWLELTQRRRSGLRHNHNLRLPSLGLLTKARGLQQLLDTANDATRPDRGILPIPLRGLDPFAVAQHNNAGLGVLLKHLHHQVGQLPLISREKRCRSLDIRVAQHLLTHRLAKHAKRKLVRCHDAQPSAAILKSSSHSHANLCRNFLWACWQLASSQCTRQSRTSHGGR